MGSEKIIVQNTALIQIIDMRAESFDSRKTSAVMMDNMSAAFDVVSNTTFFKKFEAYSVYKNSTDWFRSYLGDMKKKAFL